MSAESSTEVTPTRRDAREPTPPWPAVPSVAARVIAESASTLDARDPVRAHRCRQSARHRTHRHLGSCPVGREAQRTATVFLSEYAATVRTLESVPGSLVPRAELVVVDAPGPAARVTVWGTSIPVVLLCAALIGLVLGSTAAVLRSIFDNSASQRRDASQIDEVEIIRPTGTDLSIDTAPVGLGAAQGDVPGAH